MNGVAKVCRKQTNVKPRNPKKRTINTVDEEPHPEYSLNFLRSTKFYESDYSSGEDDMVAVFANGIAENEPLKMPIKVCNISTSLLVNSGSGRSILNRSLASQVLKSSPYAVWIHEKVRPQLRTFSNEPFSFEGNVNTPLKSNGWTSNLAAFTAVADGLKSLIGRDLFDNLGLAVTLLQLSSSSRGNQVDNLSSSSEFNQQITENFPNMISRIGRSENHVAKSNFHKDFQPRHQRGRRIPFNLQYKVNKELKNLLDEKHIIKLSSCPDNYFLSHNVCTVIEDQTIRLALDSKILNKATHKNKYQMPNIDTPIQSISQQTSASSLHTTTYFSTLDMKYAYSHLDTNTANHCNLIITSGDMTGTYRFQTGFYGLTDMPAEFQKAMDYILIGLKILIVSSTIF